MTTTPTAMEQQPKQATATGAPPLTAGWPRVPVSVVILTLNEEINIKACLESCGWSDDVHVLDSCSTDKTRELAESLGARVWVNPFKSYGAQHNWAIDNIELKHDWVFHLDADERFTREQVEEMTRVISADPIAAGYFVPSKLMFMGQWLRRSGMYPSYQMRFYHKARMRFEDYGHAQRECTDGVIGRLSVPYLHYNFSKGLDAWFDKHNRYSRLEAAQSLAEMHGSIWRSFANCFNHDPIVRRRGLKSLAYRLPFRGVLVFLHLMFVRGGVFDGRAGWTYAQMRALYEQMVSVKFAVLRQERAAKKRASQ